MLSIDFPEANFTFKKPSDMTDEQCSDLRAWKGEAKIEDTEGRVPVIITKWRFNKEDLEEIQRTGEIYLSICGSSMPPVSLFTENPL